MGVSPFTIGTCYATHDISACFVFMEFVPVCALATQPAEHFEHEQRDSKTSRVYSMNIRNLPDELFCNY